MKKREFIYSLGLAITTIIAAIVMFFLVIINR